MSEFNNTIDDFQPIDVPATGILQPQAVPAVIANRQEKLKKVDELLALDNIPSIDDIRTSDYAQVGSDIAGQPLTPDSGEPEVLTSAIQNILQSDLAPATRLDLINEARTQFARDQRIDQQAILKMAEAEAAKDVTRWQEGRQAFLEGEIGDALSVNETLAKVTEEVEALKSGGLLNTAQDFVSAELLGWFMKPVNGKAFLEQMFDVDGDVFDNISNANLSEQATFNWNQLSPEEQIRRLEAAPAIIKRIQEAGGDNDFDIDAMLQMLQGVTGSTENYEELRNGQIFEPFLNIVTAGRGGFLGAGYGVKKGLEVRKSIRTSSAVPRTTVAGMLARVSPRAAKKTLLGAVKDRSGIAATELGSDRGALVAEYVGPKSVDDRITRGPDLGLDDTLGTVEELTDEALFQGVDGDFFLKEGAEAASRDAHRGLDKVMERAAENGSVDYSKTVFGVNERNELTANYLIRNVDGQEFVSPRQAFEYMEDHFPTQRLDNLQLLRLSSKNDDYVPVDRFDNLDAQGAYFLQATFARDVADSGTAASLFRDGVNPTRKVPFTNHYLANIADTAGSFDEDLSGALSRQALSESRIKSIGQRIEKPFTKLNAKKQGQVNDVLTEGESEMKWYSDQELRSKFGDKRELIDGYKAVRRFREWDMALEEAGIRRSLVGQGYRYLDGGGDASIVRRTTEQLDEVWDSKTKSFRAPLETDHNYELLRPKRVCRYSHCASSGWPGAERHTYPLHRENSG